MNKGLTLKLLGIVLGALALGIIVLSCTPKKSGAELAMEAKIAEMEKQLAALSGTGNEAKAAELQAELQTAQAGLEAAKGNQNNQTQAAAGGTAGQPQIAAPPPPTPKAGTAATQTATQANASGTSASQTAAGSTVCQ
jgi:hypothetical protein